MNPTLRNALAAFQAWRSDERGDADSRRRKDFFRATKWLFELREDGLLSDARFEELLQKQARLHGIKL